MLAGLIQCISYTTHVLEHDTNPSFPPPLSKLVSPITSTIIIIIGKCYVRYTPLTFPMSLRVETRGPGNRLQCQVPDPSESLGTSYYPFMPLKISKLPLLLALPHWIIFLS